MPGVATPTASFAQVSTRAPWRQRTAPSRTSSHIVLVLADVNRVRHPYKDCTRNIDTLYNLPMLDFLSVLALRHFDLYRRRLRLPKREQWCGLGPPPQCCEPQGDHRVHHTVTGHKAFMRTDAQGVRPYALCVGSRLSVVESDLLKRHDPGSILGLLLVLSHPSIPSPVHYGAT